MCLAGGDIAGLTAEPLTAVQAVTRNILAAGPSRVADLARRLGCEALFAGAPVELVVAPIPADGAPIAGPHGDAFALGLAFGALTADQLDLAADHTNGVLRLSPWRALVLQGVTDAARLATSGFITDPADPRLALSACPGAPACASAFAPVRADAAALAAHGLRAHVHLSGCAKGCAHPQASPFTLVAAPDGYGLVQAGRAGDPPQARGLSLAAAAQLISAQLP